MFFLLRKKEWLAALFIAIITFFVFLPALNNGFVNWDDDNYVYRNTAIQHLDSRLFTWVFQFHSSNWHPLTWLSHALDYALWGATPTGHHAGNIILHSLNSFLLCLLIMYLIRFASPAESLIRIRISDEDYNSRVRNSPLVGITSPSSGISGIGLRRERMSIRVFHAPCPYLT